MKVMLIKQKIKGNEKSIGIKKKRKAKEAKE
jgi:hypothetical protein